jgi:hypothetical protein
MTRQQFIDRAVRKAERENQIPKGWWGGWREITNGSTVVRFIPSSWCWVIKKDGRQVSKHDSRTFAIAKARRLR